MWATCLRSDFSVYHAEFHEGCCRKQATSSDISGYHADFHEGHGIVGECQGRGRGTTWYV
jgi:hypothetical protein